MPAAHSSVTEPVATAILRTPFLTAAFSNELLVALADPLGCVTDPTATAVLQTQLKAAILTKERLITDTFPSTALPALGTPTAASLIEQSPTATAVKDT